MRKQEYLLFLDMNTWNKAQTERLSLIYDSSSLWGVW
jgi:hypothetical protein